MMIDSSSTRPTGRPRDARTDRAIVSAALELMAERGVHAVRMDDVAQRAGVGKAAMYRRYRSKDEMVIDAVATLVNEIEIPDTGSTRTDLMAFMGQAVELYSGSLAAQLMPTVVEEMRRNTGLASTVRDGFLARRRAALRAVLDAGIRRGDLSHDLDVELVLDIFGGTIFYRLLITGGAIDEHLAEGVVELILRGFAPTMAVVPRQTRTKDERK